MGCQPLEGFQSIYPYSSHNFPNITYLEYRTKTLAQSRPIVAKLTSLSLIAGVSFAGISGFSEKASAYHKTNRPEVEQSLASGGWTVIYSKEFSHAEYMKLAAAIAADVVVSKGGATSVYFEGSAVDSLQKSFREQKQKPRKWQILSVES